MHFAKKALMSCALGFFGVQAAAVTGADTISACWDGSGPNDGSTWDDTFNNLQTALDAARLGDCCNNAGCEICVAAGTYNPNGGYAPPASPNLAPATATPSSISTISMM